MEGRTGEPGWVSYRVGGIGGKPRAMVEGLANAILRSDLVSLKSFTFLLTIFANPCNMKLILAGRETGSKVATEQLSNLASPYGRFCCRSSHLV